MSWRGFALLSGFWLTVGLGLFSRPGLPIFLVVAAIVALVWRIVHLRREGPRSREPAGGRSPRTHLGRPG